MCQQVSGRLRWGWLLGCVVSFATLPVVGAESLPASVRACSAITDSLQRLVCYDREVAKFPAPAAKADQKSAPAAANDGTQAAGAATGGGAVSASSAPGATSAAASASSGSGHSTAAASGAQAAPNSASPTAKSNSTAVASGDDHVTAHIVSIDHQANEMILHLDSGQVWQEVQSVSGDLSLQEGDAIKIDRHFGSFWLTGPHVSSMKVQRKT